jgi:hypothetical protein
VHAKLSAISGHAGPIRTRLASCHTTLCQYSIDQKLGVGGVAMAKVVVVFDFDKTIIDCDSDNWVV